MLCTLKVIVMFRRLHFLKVGLVLVACSFSLGNRAAKFDDPCYRSGVDVCFDVAPRSGKYETHKM